MKPHRRRITIPLDGFSRSTLEWYKSGYHISARDHRVFVYERGTGPVVLFLHGFPTSCYDWRALIQRLNLNGRRVAFDFLGYGLSDKPEAFGYSLFQQADLVEAVMSELGIDAAHIVSHDMGTSVHCELLARQNAGQLGFRINSSSLLNGSMLQSMAHITPFQQMLASNDRLDEAIEICRGDFESIYVPALRSLMQRPEMLTEEDEIVMNDLMRYQSGAHRIPALAGYMRERYLHRDRWLGALDTNETPLQFIWADGDPIAHAAMGHKLHEMVPQARFAEVVGLGHFLLLEDPDAVAKELQPLIGSTPSTAAHAEPSEVAKETADDEFSADQKSAGTTETDPLSSGVDDDPDERLNNAEPSGNGHSKTSTEADRTVDATFE